MFDDIKIRIKNLLHTSIIVRIIKFDGTTFISKENSTDTSTSRDYAATTWYMI